MPINKLFGGSIHTGALALDARLERQGLIESNVANLETPGYKMQDFPFRRVMENALLDRGRLERTHPRHITPDPLTVAEALEFSAESRPVDLDEEMMKLSENQLMYQVTTRLVTKKFEALKFAIDETSK